jgi:hypothetical protein
MKERVLRATLIGLSAAAWLAFIGLAAVRITHPFPLDAGEGAWLDESTRLAQGQPLYVAPTLAYVPLPVMPGFALVASALVSVFGAHFWILRLLASTATLLIAWLVGFAVRRETKSPLLGMVAAGLWLGAFAATGARFDLGRPDTWSWAWSIAALVTLRFTRGDVGAAAAALLMTVALSCSLLNSVFALAALIHLAVNDRPRLAAHGLTLAVLAAGAWMGLSRVLGPWFTFYTWRLPLHQLVHGAPRIGQWARLGLVDFLGPVAVSCLLASALPTPQWRGPTGVWIWAALGGVAATLVGALGPPGMSAGLGPAAATLAIAGPVALARVVKHVATWPGSERAGRMWALHAVLLVQFVALAHGFRAAWPDGRARAEYPVLLERLRSLRGPVLAPGYGALSSRAGHGPAFDPLALDLLAEASEHGVPMPDTTALDRLLEPLRAGAERPTLVLARRLEDLGEAPWPRAARGYRLEAEWKELAGSPAPHFVYVPDPTIASAPATPVADIIEPAPGSTRTP